MADERVFEALGFEWDRSLVPTEVPVHSVERAVFRLHKALPEFVWDASVLEGNPFSCCMPPTKRPLTTRPRGAGSRPR